MKIVKVLRDSDDRDFIEAPFIHKLRHLTREAIFLRMESTVPVDQDHIWWIWSSREECLEEREFSLRQLASLIRNVTRQGDRVSVNGPLLRVVVHERANPTTEIVAYEDVETTDDTLHLFF